MMRHQRRLGAWWGRLPTAPTSVHPRRGISTSSPDAQTMASTCSPPGTTLSAASSWMGMSTPLHRAQKPLRKEDVEGLASMPLTHVVPSRVSDHVCIRLVRMLRWVADRLFRERLVHRALVLKCIASSPAAAGLVVEHVRCTLSSSQASLGTSASPSPVATETQPRIVLPSKDVRRLLSNLGECQQAHMRMVLDLARLSFPERLALLLAQCVHCAVFSVVFALSRRAGFRLIGYLLEESSVMFTHMINDLDMEKLPVDTHSPGPAALRYWGLDPQFIVTEHTTSGTQSAQEPQAGASVGKERVQTDADVRGGDSAIDAASATDPAPKDPNDDGDARVLLTLRDVALLMRADDMTYRDLVHAAATHMDVVRDQTASGGAPPTAFR